MSDDGFKHIENLTPANFRRKSRPVAQDDAPSQVVRPAAAQKDGEAGYPPTPPSRLRTLLLPADEQLLATQYFVDWMATVPPLITARKDEILGEFIDRCDSLLSQPDAAPTTANACHYHHHHHPLHQARRSYTTSYVVNLVLRAADDAKAADLQTPGSINERLLPFLRKWSRPSTSGPITTLEAVRKRRYLNAQVFQFTGACAKSIGDCAHAIPLFNIGQYELRDVPYVENMAPSEQQQTTEGCSTIFGQLDPEILLPSLVPAMKRLPMYSLLELYPLSATLHSQFLSTRHETQEERLYREHNDARTEVVASKIPQHDKPNEHLYPACQTFIKAVIEHLRLTKTKRQGKLRFLSDDLDNPASKQYLLRLRNKDDGKEEDCIESESESQVAFSLAIPYFSGTKQIQLSEQGQDWRLNWPSNKVFAFAAGVKHLRPLSDGYLQVHVQSFKKS